MSVEHSVLAGVRDLIAAGHHLNEVPGRPGVALAGGAAFRGDRQFYWRGTSEFAAAHAEGLLDRLPPPPGPASPHAIVEAENLVGSALPALLRDLYAEANGGFGPGYGLLGLRGGYTDDMHRTAIDILAEAPQGLWPGMPTGLLPLCHWGCAIYSFVHCPTGVIYGWDPNPVESDDDPPFFRQEYDIQTWMRAWLDGTLQQPWLIYDSETRTYRGATIEETKAALDDES